MHRVPSCGLKFESALVLSFCYIWKVHLIDKGGNVYTLVLYYLGNFSCECIQNSALRPKGMNGDDYILDIALYL